MASLSHAPSSRAGVIDTADDPIDFSGNKVLLKLSGGINSAAALCFLAEHQPAAMLPAELHLYYSHFREHSPDTMRFVAALIRFARRSFPVVKTRITRNSVNAYFEKQGTIPHPTLSPCSIDLKIEPSKRYSNETACDFAIIGFVSTEQRRVARAASFGSDPTLFQLQPVDLYPIQHLNDEDCFELVRGAIGWYPKIYDIRWTKEDAETGRCRPFEVGRRVFSHNNCLPCKNMSSRQLVQVGRHFPKYAQRAMETASRIPGAYWGRDDVPEVFACDSCTRFN